MRQLILNLKPTHFVIGLAPDGGRLPDLAKDANKSQH